MNAADDGAAEMAVDDARTVQARIADMERRLAEAQFAGKEARAREEQLATHNRVLVDLSSASSLEVGDLQAAFRRITEAAAGTLNVERASIWLFSDDRSAFRCLNLFERDAGRHTQGLELKTANYPVYFRAVEEDRTIAADDARSDPRTREFRDGYLLPVGITSMLDAPIRRDGRLLGVICHEHIGAPRRWSLEEQAFAGSIADFVSITLASDERRHAEARQAMLIRELDHRVKNNLAAVLSLAERTVGSSRTLHEFAPAFAGRIRAMAVAHQLLAATNWDGADLGKLIRRIVEPQCRTSRGAVAISGPAIQVPATIAPSLAMIIHELTVNAGRHGALSMRNGRVNVVWSAERSQQGASSLRLMWKEEDGPPVTPPAKRGFGLDLIEGTASYQLRGQAKVIFDRSGVVCDMVIPIELGDDSLVSEQMRAQRAAAPFVITSNGSNNPQSRRLDGTHVLVVEDDFLVAQSLGSSLAAAGCDVIGPASNPDEAARLLKTHPVDAAVLDITLSPGTSAPIARSLQYKGCPFVFVTGYTNIGALPDELRGHRVLAKPVDGTALCSAIYDLTHAGSA